MIKSTKLLSIFVLLVTVGLLGSSCELAKYTGGGTIPGATSGKANFGFNINGCKDPATSNITFHDKADGVKLKGWVTEAATCPTLDSLCGKCAYIYHEVCDDVKGSGFSFIGAAKVAYTSKNPKEPDTFDDIEDQEAILCISDRGEGANDPPDFAAIYIKSGPFEDYANCGEVSGNVQMHECPEEED